jgi:hypothetical protein
LEYHEDEERDLLLKSRSPDLNYKHFPVYPIDAVMLSPLCGEISVDYVEKLNKMLDSVYFGVDVQGFIREVDNNGKISLSSEKAKDLFYFMELLDDRLILKGSEQEMKVLSDIGDFGVSDSLVITTCGKKGSVIRKRGEQVLKICAYKPRSVMDETGLGDVYGAIFVYEYLNSDKSWESVRRAGLTASSAASFLVEYPGPSGFVSKKKVIKRLENKKYI